MKKIVLCINVAPTRMLSSDVVVVVVVVVMVVEVVVEMVVV